MIEPQTSIARPSLDEFTALLEESLAGKALQEGSVVKGEVVSIEKDVAVIDVGLKTEGRVALREFCLPGRPSELVVGDVVDVYLERVENAAGEAVLSREKARREESWTRLEEKYKANEKVEGQIFNRVKGGFTVDLDGAVAFLPGSQVDIRPIRDVGPLMNTPQPFQILKMDRRRGNIVVSRRAVLEETRAEKRSEIVARLKEGEVIEGVVKNITDYGAFIDLGGIDGLLHVTDMAWRRVNHPSEIVNVGDTVKVQIIRINIETQRISLGIKQLESDPWDGIAAKYPVDSRFKGTVTNITDYGAFVELEPGVEGLIHVSEMSWTKKNIHPGKIISTSQEVEVQVLDVDPDKRRISLGLKQTQENPWIAFAGSHESGAIIEGQVRNITEFGLFVGLDGGIDGMVHLSDLDWSKSGEEALAEFKKGDTVKAVVLEADSDKERISLGIKQLTPDPFEGAVSSANLKRGMRVTCEVTAVKDNGLEAKLIDHDLITFIRRSDLSRDRSEQRPDRFGVGEKFDAVVTQVDIKTRRVSTSIKALEIAEEKEAVAQYGSTDSGASLGDILGAALNKAKGDEPEVPEETAEEPAEKPKPKRATKAKTTKAKAAKAKAAKDEAAKDESAKDEAAKDEPAKDEAAKDKATKAKSAKAKTTKAKAAKDEAAKDEPAKDEPAESDASAEK
jgi:small subunit ribosomal protein S1